LLRGWPVLSGTVYDGRSLFAGGNVGGAEGSPKKFDEEVGGSAKYFAEGQGGSRKNFAEGVGSLRMRGLEEPLVAGR